MKRGRPHQQPQPQRQQPGLAGDDGGNDNMARISLSPSLKALINAPSARPGPRPAPSGIRELYQAIARDAAQRNVGVPSWLVLATAATFTLNSPDSLAALHRVASDEEQARDGSSSSSLSAQVRTAEFIREVGLKCISFNGIPRTINGLNSFRAALPESVASQLATSPRRQPTPENLPGALARGRQLWDSIYRPLENKLIDKLAQAHPDLPVYIIANHYAALLADPEAEAACEAAQGGKLASVGRVHTSMAAIACLRAQTGVGPQLLSHVFGLRKGVEDGTYQNDAKDGAAYSESDEAVRWLAGDEGSEWILHTVDKIVEAVGGPSFAPGGRDSKL